MLEKPELVMKTARQVKELMASHLEHHGPNLAKGTYEVRGLVPKAELQKLREQIANHPLNRGGEARVVLQTTHPSVRIPGTADPLHARVVVTFRTLTLANRLREIFQPHRPVL